MNFIALQKRLHQEAAETLARIENQNELIKEYQVKTDITERERARSIEFFTNRRMTAHVKYHNILKQINEPIIEKMLQTPNAKPAE